jgi:hypothetical protein
MIHTNMESFTLYSQFQAYNEQISQKLIKLPKTIPQKLEVL